MPPPNVYSSHHRFLDFHGGDNLLRILREESSAGLATTDPSRRVWRPSSLRGLGQEFRRELLTGS
jgi:hypothetical protein